VAFGTGAQGARLAIDHRQLAKHVAGPEGAHGDAGGCRVEHHHLPVLDEKYLIARIPQVKDQLSRGKGACLCMLCHLPQVGLGQALEQRYFTQRVEDIHGSSVNGTGYEVDHGWFLCQLF